MQEADVCGAVNAVLEEVKELAQARREQMDISHIAKEPDDPSPEIVYDSVDDSGGWTGYDEWGQWRDTEVNVNLIGKGVGGKTGKGKGKGNVCYTCGALGHMSWECPSNWQRQRED